MVNVSLEDAKFVEEKDILGACVRVVELIGHNNIVDSAIINGKYFPLFSYHFYADDKILVFNNNSNYTIIDEKDNKEVFRLEMCHNPKKENGPFIHEEEYFTNGGSMKHNSACKVHNFKMGSWMGHLLTLDYIINKCSEKGKYPNHTKKIINKIYPLTKKFDWSPILNEMDLN